MNLKVVMTGLCLCVSPVVMAEQIMAQPIVDQKLNTQQNNASRAHDKYHVFFDALKENILKQDKQKVAAVVKYPLIVELNGKQVKMRTQRQFIKNYDAIITPKIQKIVREQQFEGLISTFRGMAFGNGEIWFAGICQKKSCNDQNKTKIKIIGVNSFM